MIDDLWLSIDLPILTAIVEAEATMPASHPHFVEEKILERSEVDLDHGAFIKSIMRLSDGNYIDATLYRGGGSVLSYQIRGVFERGRRVTGQWPPDDAYLSLLSLMSDRIESATDEPTRTKLRAALEGILGVGREIGTDLAAEWLKRITVG